jgi:hypothetical protein
MGSTVLVVEHPVNSKVVALKAATVIGSKWNFILVF